MSGLFASLFLVSILCFIIGIIKPKIFSKLIKNVSRKKTSLIFGIAIIICLILTVILSSSIPLLDKVKSPTNQKEVMISGRNAFKNSSIKIILNGEVKSEIKSDEKGIFSSTIELKEGENKIKASATNEKSETKTSSEIIVVYDITPPSLSIEQISSQTDNEELAIKGESEAQAEISITRDSQELKKEKIKEAKFEIKINLNAGENKLQITSYDEAGNKSEVKEATITYTPKQPITKEAVKPEENTQKQEQQPVEQKTDQQILTEKLTDLINKFSGTTNVSYRDLKIEKSDPDRPQDTKMITVSINVKDFYNKSAFIKDTGKLSSQVFQDVYSANLNAYDVIVWYYSETTDRYGNKTDNIIQTYAIDKTTYGKIAWQNFDQQGLCNFLDQESKLTESFTGCHTLVNIK